MRSPPLLVTALVQTASVATTSANDPRAALSNQAARTGVNEVAAAYIGLQKKSLYEWFQLPGNDPLNQGVCNVRCQTDDLSEVTYSEV